LSRPWPCKNKSVMIAWFRSICPAAPWSQRPVWPQQPQINSQLGNLLVDMGLVSDEQLEIALAEQNETIDSLAHLNGSKLAAMMEIGSIVNSSLNLAEVLQLIMNFSNRVTGSVASTLMLLDHETGELVFSVPTGPKETQLTDIRLPPGQGIAGWVAQHQQPLLIGDPQNDPRFYCKIDETTGFKTESILAVPLKAKGKLIGVLEVVNKQDGSGFSKGG
jgi:transcriptional regulator with GAF, ATPase, and Fis domain